MDIEMALWFCFCIVVPEIPNLLQTGSVGKDILCIFPNW